MDLFYQISLTFALNDILPNHMCFVLVILFLKLYPQFQFLPQIPWPSLSPSLPFYLIFLLDLSSLTPPSKPLPSPYLSVSPLSLFLSLSLSLSFSLSLSLFLSLSLSLSLSLFLSLSASIYLKICSSAAENPDSSIFRLSNPDFDFSSFALWDKSRSL